MNITICFALVLDPRCKLEILRFCLCNLYGPMRGKMQVEKVKTEMSMLYDEYAKEQPASSSGSVSVSERQGRGHVESSSSAAALTSEIGEEIYLTVEEFNLRRMNDAGSNMRKLKTELDKYLAEEVDPYKENFDVMLWWKVKKSI